jgi:hypothetical protein
MPDKNNVEKRSFSHIVPPPREVPFEITAGLICWGQKNVFTWLFFFFTIVAIYNASSATGYNNPLSQIGDIGNKRELNFMIVWWAAFFVSVFFVGKRINEGLGIKKMLSTWLYCEAKFVKKDSMAETPGMFGYKTYSIALQIIADNKEHIVHTTTNDPKRLEDEPFEPVFYDPADPEDALVLDALPIEIKVDDSGKLKLSKPPLALLGAAMLLSLGLLAVVILLIKTYVRP